jgi:hypothetical protein
MVLVFTGESDSAADLLSSLKRHQTDLVENETRVLAIIVGAQQRAFEIKHALHLNFSNGPARTPTSCSRPVSMSL